MKPVLSKKVMDALDRIMDKQDVDRWFVLAGRGPESTIHQKGYKVQGEMDADFEMHKFFNQLRNMGRETVLRFFDGEPVQDDLGENINEDGEDR